MHRRPYTGLFAAIVVGVAACWTGPGGGRPSVYAQEKAAPALSELDATEIGMDAYVYLYPLVTMDVTRRVATSITPGLWPGVGPANTFAHIRTYPNADFRAIVRPNFDTLYSPGWLDLSAGPVIVSAPDTAGRYYLLPMMDMWSDVFASPGKRTTGTAAAHYAVVPPGWKGELPAGVSRIDAPTPHVWVIGRTQTNGPKDYAAVHKVQDGYTITPLARWGQPPVPVKTVVDPTVNVTMEPLRQVNAMPAARFFAYAADLLKAHPPHLTDWSILARMKRIGLEPGKAFDLAAADPVARKALERVPADAQKVMKEKTPTIARVANGWQMNTDTMGVYGNYYLKRAIIASIGLGAVSCDDAIYPLCVSDADGRPLRGENRYVLHFEKAELPPVDAFWSVTMYDAEGFPVANPLNRFAIGDRDQLRYNADGSLDLYFQHDKPAADAEANWLPTPATGLLGVTMRLYAPQAQALDGRWNPPAVRKVR